MEAQSAEALPVQPPAYISSPLPSLYVPGTPPVAGYRAPRQHHTRSSATDTRASTRAAAATMEGPSTRSRKRRATNLTAAEPKETPRPKRKTRTKTKASLKKPPSAAADDEKKPAAATAPVSCCICMCDIEAEEVAEIDGCAHRFCFGCIEKWAERENTCPLCKARFTKIDRVSRKRRKGQQRTKKVKQRDQRSEMAPGVALENLLGKSPKNMVVVSEDPTFLSSFRHLTPFFFGYSANIAGRAPPPGFTRLFISSSRGETPFSLAALSAAGAGRSTRPPRFATRSDESSDDDQSPFSSFLRSFQGRTVVQVVRQPMPRAPPRSYASNVNDVTAGRGAENPLDLCDSDDDDAVEVVQVTRP